jgi:hypothetical protein
MRATRRTADLITKSIATRNSEVLRSSCTFCFPQVANLTSDRPARTASLKRDSGQFESEAVCHKLAAGAALEDLECSRTRSGQLDKERTALDKENAAGDPCWVDLKVWGSEVHCYHG